MPRIPFLPYCGWKSMWVECLASPDMQYSAKEAPLSLTPSRVLSCDLHDWEAGKRRGERHTGIWQGIKEMQILLTVPWLHQEAYPWATRAPSPWSPQLGNGYPQGSTYLTHTHPTCGWLPVHISNGSESELWQTLSKQTQKVNLNLWAMGRPQTWETKKERCQYLASCVAGSGEGIQP